MTYDFSSRLDLLGTRMKELHNVSLVYRRRSVSVSISNATPEQCDTEQLQALGIAILNEKWQDFVFDTADLTQFFPAEPEAGDVIVWGTDTFQVTSIGDELFKFTTSSRLRVRVHTKQIRE